MGLKQHLIDPEICIRCYTCEASCPIEAITHNDDNVVVDAAICEFCMDCIAPCPTGAIDNWRVVETPYELDEQFEWEELPAQAVLTDPAGGGEAVEAIEAFDDDIAALLAEAHAGAGGRAKAPASASKPTVNLFNLGRPAIAVVQGNYRLTDAESASDTRHVILNFGQTSFPALEGQSIGIIPPGADADGKPYLPRLYSLASPRDGERPNFNNLALTVKREVHGVCSNYICDLAVGDEVQVTGPFGATFLMPNAPEAKLLMICTGTGAAPFRAMTMRRQRQNPERHGDLMLVFGARTPEELPYFGPLKKVPESFMAKHFAFSRIPGAPKRYVQDVLLEQRESVGALLRDAAAHIYLCGLKAMDEGVDGALAEIAAGAGLDWQDLRARMRDEGRYHVETY